MTGFQNSIRANFPFMVMLSQSLSQVDPPGTASGEGLEQVTVFISHWPASYSVNPEGRDLTIRALTRKVFPERQRDTRPQLKSTCPTKSGRIAEKQQQQQNNCCFMPMTWFIKNLTFRKQNVYSWPTTCHVSTALSPTT